MDKIKNLMLAAFMPLRSRKVRVALATFLAAYLAEYGLHLSETLIVIIVTLGTALIVGIAHEDSGAKSAAPPSVAGVLTQILKQIKNGGTGPPGSSATDN